MTYNAHHETPPPAPAAAGWDHTGHWSQVHAPGPAPVGATTTDMARAALAEAGRPDLATALEPNRAGHPRIGDLADAHPDDVDVIARAAHLAHTRAGTPGWDWTGPDELAAWHRAGCPERYT